MPKPRGGPRRATVELADEKAVSVMAQTKFIRGVFKNGIPYGRFGAGPKTLLFLAGGPGNLVPTGLGAAGFVRGMRAFRDDYTIYFVTRKSGLPEGYTTKQMSDDYAELIREEFGGHVDLVMGVSYGGLIAQHFAADYPALFDHLVIVMAAHKISAAAKRIDCRYAELIHQRKDRAAMAVRAAAVFPSGPLKYVMGAALWTLGKPLLGPVDDTFRRDILIEARAEATHESTESLQRIKVPVLIVAGRDDFAFPLGAMQEMAGLIEQATLKVYQGGHTAAFLDKRLARDVREFIDHRPHSP
jgi:pimeloyl-ACP methyl ester carboxylesterase